MRERFVGKRQVDGVAGRWELVRHESGQFATL